MDILEKISSHDLEEKILLLLFFIPGFISIKTYDLFIPGEKRDFSKSIIDIFVYSSINYVLSSWLIYLNLVHAWHETCFTGFAISFLSIVFILPALLPVIFHKVTMSKLLYRYRKIHPTPVAWDFVFGKREPFWIIMHLKDGRKIGGYFGPKSFASSSQTKNKFFLKNCGNLTERINF